MCRPTSTEAHVKCDGLYSKEGGPLDDIHRAPVMGQKNIAAPVVGLNSVGGPSTVFGRVVAIVIDAVNAVLWGRLVPHVGKECLEGMPPLWTNNNASSTVVGVFWLSGVIATANQPRPTIIFSAACLPVSFKSFAGILIFKAATRNNAAVTKMFASNNMSVATRAAAIPANSSTSLGCRAADNDEATKSLTSKVYKIRHNILQWICSREKNVAAVLDTGFRFDALAT